MTMKIQFSPTTVIEFGVGLDEATAQRFVLVPIDVGVQTALREMADFTNKEMLEVNSSPNQYEPSEKYSVNEHLLLPLTDNLASQIRLIHEAVNLPVDPSVVEQPQNIFCYFARYSDGQGGNRLTAI